MGTKFVQLLQFVLCPLPTVKLVESPLGFSMSPYVLKIQKPEVESGWRNKKPKDSTRK